MNQKSPFTTTLYQIEVHDGGLDTNVVLSADRLVLSTGVRPAAGTMALAQRMKIPVGQDGFFLEAHAKLRPLDFASQGLFLGGVAQGPKFVDETITQARGAAARAGALLAQGEMHVPGDFSVIDVEHCIGCLTCVRSCPYQIPVVSEENTAFIDPASCQGCGICAAACPRRAITVNHSTTRQIIAKLDALFEEGLSL